MAIAKDKGAIKKFGGGIWKLLTITDAGTAGTEIHTDWLEMGYVESCQLKDETTEEGVNDETGNQVASLEGNRTVKITGTLMQSDKDTIDFFKDTVRGKYYSVYHYDGINDGNHQEYLFGICRIKPQIELQSGVKRIPFEITVLNNDSQLEYDEPDTGGSNAELPTDSYAQGDGGADAIWVLANQYYTITETPVT